LPRGGPARQSLIGGQTRIDAVLPHPCLGLVRAVPQSLARFRREMYRKIQ